MEGKIFCIGLNKTGTSSLHEAFELLGYSSIHHVGKEGKIMDFLNTNNRIGKPILEGIDHYNAYSDFSASSYFKKLDKQYPNSKFILNVRNIDDWIRSREKHVLRKTNLDKLREKNPNNGWYHIDKKAWEEEFKKHQSNVLNYFKDRDKDLLVFDVCAGDDWDKLCSFLNVSLPNFPFPFKNKAPEPQSFTQKINISIKTLVNRIMNGGK